MNPQEDFNDTIAGVTALRDGSPVCIRGTVGWAGEVKEFQGQHGAFQTQFFYLCQDGEPNDIGVNWSSPTTTLQGGEHVSLGQFNAAGKQGGKTTKSSYQGKPQIKVGGSCLQIELGAQAASLYDEDPPFDAPASPPLPSGPAAPDSTSGTPEGWQRPVLPATPPTQEPPHVQPPDLSRERPTPRSTMTVSDAFGLQRYLYDAWNRSGVGQEAASALTNTILIAVTNGKIKDDGNRDDLLSKPKSEDPIPF